MGYKIGVDVGGTFTDLVYISADGRINLAKTPTTAENQSGGVLQGLNIIAEKEKLNCQELLNRTDLIIHGTTVATNAMLEFKGAKTGLITTSGFRDDIELRRGYKEKIFNPRFPAPVPIAKRRHRLTLNERIDRNGQILTALDETEAVEAVRKLKDEGIESIAVSFIFSFLNPVHEKMVAEIIKKEYPECFVSLSHEVLPQVREFERLSTTLVNAYTRPKLESYLFSLELELKQLGFEGSFLVMLSGGGIVNTAYAGKYAVYSLLSGPAGGVMASSQLIAELLDVPNVITIDIGGTSCDVSTVESKKPFITTDYWFSRYRIAVPMLNINTIGAGGGSIAWIDSGGALQVGPQSAGANPGPACYGTGGKDPTVTDANLLLGILNPDNFLGGKMKLNINAAEVAVRENIAQPLGLDTFRAAEGICRIVNNNMINGIRAVSVQRGLDPRDYVLVAYGGNGAVHAGILAQELDIKKVIVPRIATAFSARGMLNADIVINKVRTYIGSSNDYDLSTINNLLSSMLEEVEKEWPRSLAIESAGSGAISVKWYADMHYRGELHEITVPLQSHQGAVGDRQIEMAVRQFHTIHEQRHTFANWEDPACFMNLRMEALIALTKPRSIKLDYTGEDSSSALQGYRPVYFSGAGGPTETPIYNGSLVTCGNIMRGPCVIEEPATTIVVCPGQAARLTEMDNYELDL